MANMKAELLAKDRVELEEGLRVEAVLWQVPVPVRGSAHLYKYRFALIDGDECVLRYDNEAGKGDHKHFGTKELPHTFTTIRDLRISFFQDVERYRRGDKRWEL
jgi:hypothetical protein